MKYFVNKIETEESSWTKDFIGLFKGKTHPSHEGNFCGYWAVEYYNDTFLLAQYSREDKNQGGKCYSSKGQPHTSEEIIKKHISKIEIGSDLWTETFEAENDEEAILKFFAEEF